MNDEPSSSAAASAPPSDNDTTTLRHARPPSDAELAERRKTNRQMFNRKRGELLDDLCRTLDILIYAELSAIYYMDCSFFRLLIRIFVQFVHLTPKPANFPDHALAHRPYIGAILGTNALCILLHAINSAPAAGEATREYLYGGLALDFIGQKGPTSKIHLLLLDVLVVILQLVHLAAHVTRQRLKGASADIAPPAARPAPVPAPPAQDLDHEERGLLRAEATHDVEMQTLNPSGTALRSTNPDTQQSGDTDSAPPRTDAHIFNAFHSGQIVLADLNIPQTVREQFWAYRNAPPESSMAESNRAMRANLVGQLLRWRVGPSPSPAVGTL